MDALSASVGEKLDELGGTLTVTYDNDTNILTWSDSQNLYSEVFLNGNCVYSGNNTSCQITPVGGDNVIDVIAFDTLRKEVKQGTITVTMNTEATLTIELDEGQTLEDVQFDGESIEYTDGIAIPTTVEKVYIRVSKIKTFPFIASNYQDYTWHYLDFEYTFNNEIGKQFKIKPYNKESYSGNNFNPDYYLQTYTNISPYVYFYNSNNRNELYLRVPFTNNNDTAYLRHASCTWDLDTNTSSRATIGNGMPFNIDIIFSEKMCLKSLIMYSAAHNDAPKKFDIQGSDDDINWVTIASDCTFEGYTTPDQQYIEFPNNKSFYKKHRIVIKEIFNPNSNCIRLRMFRFTMLKEGSVI